MAEGGSQALGVLLMDAGLACLGLGVISVLKPLRFLGIASRRRALAIATIGAALIAAASALPAPLLRSARRASRLDDFIPLYQFNEFHHLRIRAAPHRVAWAIKSVTAGEITLFRTLTWLRHPRLPTAGGRPAEENVFSAPADKPILATALRSGFVELAEEPDREIVIGTLVVVPDRPPSGGARQGAANADRFAALAARFASLSAPGYAKAALNFLVEPEDEGWCRLSTETRVFATDAGARRRFAPYWRIIYPGSALIRLEWLRAIRRRAESALPET